MHPATTVVIVSPIQLAVMQTPATSNPVTTIQPLMNPTSATNPDDTHPGIESNVKSLVRYHGMLCRDCSSDFILVGGNVGYVEIVRYPWNVTLSDTFKILRYLWNATRCIPIRHEFVSWDN